MVTAYRPSLLLIPSTVLLLRGAGWPGSADRGGAQIYLF
jgi:hypothetical protein